MDQTAIMSRTRKTTMELMVRPTCKTVAFGGPGKRLIINDGLLRTIEDETQQDRNRRQELKRDNYV